VGEAKTAARKRIGRAGVRGLPPTTAEYALPIADSEPFWPAQLAAAAALLLYLTLPHALIMGPKWLVPGVEGILLLGLVITTPTRHHKQSSGLRAVIIGMVGLVSLTTLISLALLAHFLLDGSHARGHALLFAGVVLWLTNVLIFGIWYWELDRGGPARRLQTSPRDAPDFLFPQTADTQLAPGWRPGFADYLYTSYTNATAFSPTDTLPLTAMAKCLMAAQSLIALTTILLVVARAVNVLG
jgi:uncharacterized membrane protein